MKITALVENVSTSDLKAKHGLSLYVETKKHNLLFDLGPDQTLFKNAKKRNIDLKKVDSVIISHGHVDHGGAMKNFLEINKIATVYVQRQAFEQHYIKVLGIKIPVGIDKRLSLHPQVKLIDGDFRIDEELSLFTVENKNQFYSTANESLYDSNGRDNFNHEQNLLISENEKVIFTGCGHSGIVNIIEKANNYNPNYCIGGFHLFNPVTKITVNSKLLNDLALRLKNYKNIRFYTCHCTGKKAFKYMSKQMNNLDYLSCGQNLVI
ncbi:MBL fold metallo-hydrolase [Streptococcus parasuis]|uniref:7, 8-dihydropterin-6-yl-methyl-4-(Beta-D-ribofuranosyl)aminobenzene 5'-phosphate synthase n=1 Tax=Streptococcus parasuis TaxID=1501662 RepID=A0ABV2ESG8_9STRE|nr:MBL fold metallo-hydrolase [Streptococcus parasuis]MCQ8267001.1 MBL fold metallo-hydrolase [Streptococcus suis]BCP60494.1 MBL fold hydrolase [Streptococcus parasuis]